MEPIKRAYKRSRNIRKESLIRNNIAGVNDLVYVATKLVEEMFAMKETKSKQKEQTCLGNKIRNTF